eukprot:g4704.t1
MIINTKKKMKRNTVVSRFRGELRRCSIQGDTDGVFNAIRSTVSGDDCDAAESVAERFVNTLFQDGSTALHHAASRGHIGVVKMLLHFGARADMREKSAGRTPLHSAAMVGNLEIVQMFLMACATATEQMDLIDLIDDNGMTSASVCRVAMSHWQTMGIKSKIFGRASFLFSVANGILRRRKRERSERHLRDFHGVLHALETPPVPL